MKKVARITISLSMKEYSALEALAVENDASLSWVARRAINDYINDHQPGIAAEQELLFWDAPRRGRSKA